jgi:hypothetical protein
MFNIFSHQENANQNYKEIPSQANQNGYHQKKKKKKTKKQVLPRMGIGQRKEPLYLVGIATMEISMEAPPKGRKNRTI